MGTSSHALSFDRDVRPLFRDSDRQAMDFAFDLWDYQDVRDNADAILEQLESGRMPCDESWPEEETALFRRWAGEGMGA